MAGIENRNKFNRRATTARSSFLREVRQSTGIWTKTKRESPLKESDRAFGATRAARKLRWKNVDKRVLLADQVDSESGLSEGSRRGSRAEGGSSSRSSRAGSDPSATGSIPVKTSRTDSKMEIIFLISFCLGLATGFRGPHHPRSSVSHHHYTPQKEVKLTQDAELLHDATHLKEDMGYIGNQLDFSKMSEQEIEFHYFQIHDIDNNTKLDGLEIFHALEHTLHESDEEDTMQDTEQDLIIELIDKVLEEDDLNNDGYLEYVEFVLGRQRDHIAQEKRNKFKIET